MNLHCNKTRLGASCLGLSLLAHILFLFPLKLIGDYHFAAPVRPIQAVMVDLQTLGAKPLPIKVSDDKVPDGTDALAEEENEALPPPLASERSESDTAAATPSEQSKADPEPAVSAENSEKGADPSAGNDEVTRGVAATASRQGPPAIVIPPPLRAAGEFLTTKHEKLSYQISLHGVPVGSAEMEAKNEKGEIRITLRTKSNRSWANIFPVDDVVETRHIGGNFILTKFRQHEGTLKRNIGFTIFLRDKSVFWIDLVRMRSRTEPVPTSEVLDTLSAFYYLRNRQLQIGKTEMLHIYDGETYADVPVEVLRRESVLLPNLKEVDTLVVRPVQQPDGIFKRTRDILIWLTNDENKVPVKVETSIPLGRVTAVLVSAEEEDEEQTPA